MTRAWEVNDPVAEFRGGRWRIGVVTSVHPWLLAIRWDGAELISSRSPGDVHLVDPEQVPVDERHWVPATVRDQLVRQEAAAALRAMAEHLPPGPDRVIAGCHLARHFDDLIGRPDEDGYSYAAAARALLAPAPQPATTPTTGGLPA